MVCTAFSEWPYEPIPGALTGPIRVIICHPHGCSESIVLKPFKGSMACLHLSGRKLLRLFHGTGEIVILLLQTLFYFKEAPRNLPSIFRQLYEIGVGTLPITALMGLFVGMVLALQTGSQLALYGTQDVIGAIVGLSMVKELGPVMTSLLVAGRIGSAMAAEVGAMEVYEEIDALKTFQISPVRYLAMPRLLGCLLAMPALVVFAIVVGVIGGAIVSSVNPLINVPVNVYYDNLIQALNYMEILKGTSESHGFRRHNRRSRLLHRF